MAFEADVDFLVWSVEQTIGRIAVIEKETTDLNTLLTFCERWEISR